MNTNENFKDSNSKIFLGLGLAVSLAALFVLSISLYAYLAKVEDPFAQLDLGFAIFVVFYTLIGAFLVLRLGIIKLGGLSLEQIGWRVDNLKLDVLYGVAGAAVAVGIVYLLGLIFGTWDEQQFIGEEMKFSFSNRIVFLLIGLNAGLIEESLFRGFLQPTAIQKFGFVFGLFFTSFIFAAYHLKFQLPIFIGKFALGIIFGLSRGRDRSLIRPGLAHALLWACVGTL